MPHCVNVKFFGLKWQLRGGPRDLTLHCCGDYETRGPRTTKRTQNLRGGPRNLAL